VRCRGKSKRLNTAEEGGRGRPKQAKSQAVLEGWGLPHRFLPNRLLDHHTEPYPAPQFSDINGENPPLYAFKVRTPCTSKQLR
jgi:hypothetical protein